MKTSIEFYDKFWKLHCEQAHGKEKEEQTQLKNEKINAKVTSIYSSKKGVPLRPKDL